MKIGKALTNNQTVQTRFVDRIALKFRDYYILTKPEVNLLILMTTSAGYYLGLRGPFHALGLIHTLVGTLLVASGTATLNQWMEKKWDGQMRRTANRPLPSGRISSSEAFFFGLLLSICGGLYLALLVNTLSSLLAISTLLSYLFYVDHDWALPIGYADLDWLGGRLWCDHSAGDVSVHDFVSVAVSSFSRNSIDVSRRLCARWLPNVATVRPGFALHARRNSRLHPGIDCDNPQFSHPLCETCICWINASGRGIFALSRCQAGRLGIEDPRWTPSACVRHLPSSSAWDHGVRQALNGRLYRGRSGVRKTGLRVVLRLDADKQRFSCGRSCENQVRVLNSLASPRPGKSFLVMFIALSANG